VSELWDRCRPQLRERMSQDDWRRCIAPLRAWFDADMLYLWVDREADDWHTISNPASDHDRAIRDTVRQVSGRAARAVHYLDRPPNRESIINQRRLPEHRSRRRASDDRLHKLLCAYALEEARRFEDDPPDLRMCRTDVERRVKLETIAMDRAKRRLAREPLASVFGAGRRGEAPRDPPAWPPDRGER
jgi:hypothetical protein